MPTKDVQEKLKLQGMTANQVLQQHDQEQMLSIVQGYRGEAVRNLVNLDWAITNTGFEEITDENLMLVMLTAEVFVKHGRKYIEKKTELKARGIVDGEG